MVVLGEPAVDLGGRWLSDIATNFSSGDPLTPLQACCLRVVTAFVPKDAWTQWDRYLLGQDDSVDAWPLVELPEWVLDMVNPMWLHHFLRVFVDIGRRIEVGQAPYPRSIAERVALWIAIWQAMDIDPAVNHSMVHEAIDRLVPPTRGARAEMGWNHARDRLFAGDLDFLRIWRDDFDHIALRVPGRAGDHAESEVGRFHPFYWWDMDVPS